MSGWKDLLKGWPWFHGAGNFALLPNSEFMPPVRLILKPYGTWDTLAVSEDDPHGWPISEYEEALSLRPGLHDIARQVLNRLVPLAQGLNSHGISEYKLRENPYWPPELARRSPTLEHERFVLLLPLALSITQDWAAHLRWTVFGNSEQGPARPFWKSFYTAPRRPLERERGLTFFRALLTRVYHEPAEKLRNLKAAGLRILPQKPGQTSASHDEPWPDWADDFVLGDGEPLRGVRYLLTFRPFADLPSAVKRRYFAGSLHLLPFPGSLFFWGAPGYRKLSAKLRLAEQVPLLHLLERHEALGKLRVPQSGWFEEATGNNFSGPHRDRPRRLPMRNTYRRLFRQARTHRFEDQLVTGHEHRLSHTLFSTRPQDIDLYHKPMARNVQLWTDQYQAILDGPVASAEEIHRAAARVAAGGLFGYRFLVPAMNVGRHELYWHRPLAAYCELNSKRVEVIDQAPTGYLTAYEAPEMLNPNSRSKRRGKHDFQHPIEFWPRFLERPEHSENVALFHDLKEYPAWDTLTNIRKLLDAFERNGQRPISRTYARALLSAPRSTSLDSWLRGLPRLASPILRPRAEQLAESITACLAAADDSERRSPMSRSASSLTYEHTANRGFEESYWGLIGRLSSGQFVNKNNADCVLDPPTQKALKHPNRDLDGMGDYILDYYEQLARERKMSSGVLIGELPFRWQTQFPFNWMGGWARNQDGEGCERNLLVVIPGRDRSRAVIMADHYDTAYMHDVYERYEGGDGARLSAAGADDNCSATAALMLGAHAFFELSRQGKLDCDIWLLHLTGEEYPAEGLGALRMCEWLVEGNLKLKTKASQEYDLSSVRVQGIYVLDMIAHNTNQERYVFQISPGNSRESQWLALRAHEANRIWNQAAVQWNQQPSRRKAGVGRRCRDGRTIPPLARHPNMHGQVRPHYDPRSTLFNTDGQGFSDIGVPVVLFMENYDIGRVGYHDTHDNMNMINLDYGAALAAITIESVARAAAERPPEGYLRGL